jgi:hypothetical protein
MCDNFELNYICLFRNYMNKTRAYNTPFKNHHLGAEGHSKSSPSVTLFKMEQSLSVDGVVEDNLGNVPKGLCSYEVRAGCQILTIVVW